MIWLNVVIVVGGVIAMGLWIWLVNHYCNMRIRTAEILMAQGWALVGWDFLRGPIVLPPRNRNIKSAAATDGGEG